MILVVVIVAIVEKILCVASANVKSVFFIINCQSFVRLAENSK
jgi:hypothetical protein